MTIGQLPAQKDPLEMIDRLAARIERKPSIVLQEDWNKIREVKKVRQTIVRLFMSQKFRWTSVGRCPVWLVPEKYPDVGREAYKG